MSNKISTYNTLSGFLFAMHAGKVKKLTKFLAPDLVVKATLVHRPDRRTKQVTAVVTAGRPNYAERKFIKDCRKAGEKFPVRKPQYKFFKRKDVS